MTFLVRYIVKNNLVLLGLLCLLLASIYSIFNFVDNISEMTSDSASFLTIIQYYFFTSPTIISLLLALLFFLGIVIQVTLLSKNKELLALLSSGISTQQIVSIFMVYSVFWACASFVITEVSIISEKKALSIYRYEIRKREKKPLLIRDLWFKQMDSILYSKVLYTETGVLYDVLLYTSLDNFQNIKSLYTAKKANFVNNTIELIDVREYDYIKGALINYPVHTVPITMDLPAMQAVNTPVSELLFVDIFHAVRALRNSGVDTKALATAIHIRITNALTFIVMTALALLISFRIQNPYMATAVSFLVAVLFFLSRELLQSLGRLQVISPIIAPWLTLLAWFILCCLFVYRHWRRS